MAELNFLKHLITEDIYLLKEDKSQAIKNASDEAKVRTEEELTTVEEAEEPLAQPEQALKFKGNATQQIYILVNESKAEYITAEDEAFLLKVLSAVKLSLNEVGIINIHNQQVGLDELKQLNPAIILLFNQENTFFTKLEQYAITNMGDLKLLWSNALSKIAADKEEKVKLWSALQALFLK